MPDDAFRELGLTSKATAAEVRAARRRLAKRHHPDTGGDANRMSAVNDAATSALRAIDDSSHRATSDASAPRDNVPDRPSTGQRQAEQDWSGVTRDAPSFTVEALPVETFEALLVVTTWMGDVIDDEPPYRLDAHLTDPAPCWCRLELVPDAGGSTVSLTLGSSDGRPPPEVEAVRDVYVANLNRYDWGVSPDGVQRP